MTFNNIYPCCQLFALFSFDGIFNKTMSSLALFLAQVLLMISVTQAQSENSLTRSGNKDFKKGKYADAEVNYRKALEKKNNMPEAIFNLGDAVYQQKRFEEAAKQFQLSGQTNADPMVRAKAYHNLGNTHMAEQKYEDAIKAYKQALKINPKDVDTKYNLAYANTMLQQQQQQQNDKNNKENQQSQKDNKDKQDQNNKDKNDQKQNQDQQNQQEQRDEKKQQAQQPKLSKADAEKLLQALQNEEQKANQKMQKANTKPVDVKVEKDW